MSHEACASYLKFKRGFQNDWKMGLPNRFKTTFHYFSFLGGKWEFCLMQKNIHATSRNLSNGENWIRSINWLIFFLLPDVLVRNSLGNWTWNSYIYYKYCLFRVYTGTNKNRFNNLYINSAKKLLEVIFLAGMNFHKFRKLSTDEWGPWSDIVLPLVSEINRAWFPQLRIMNSLDKHWTLCQYLL